MITARRSCLKTISDAQKVWSLLNGVVCVYKPSGLTVNQTRLTIMSNLCRDLNDMSVRPARKRVTIEPTSDYSNYLVKAQADLADHTLVVGERYQPTDVMVNTSNYLGRFTSGVMLFGINRGVKVAHRLRDNRPIRVYHVTGKFGRSTETHFNDSPMTAQATFDHIHVGKMNSLLASLTSSHQSKMFELCGVDPQSQAAYELAKKGPIRPANATIPLIYSARCIEFKRPYFTIEIHACSESENYMGILIHEIGIDLKSLAHCTQIRCIRQSHFTLDDALVKRHWNVETILANMRRCKEILHKHPEMLQQLNPILKSIDNNNNNHRGVTEQTEESVQ